MVGRSLGERVGAAVARTWSGSRLVRLEPLPGGYSSETYRAAIEPGPAVDGAAAPSTAVIKVAPAGVAPVGNRDVLRQARVLRSLDGSGVRAPAVLFEDPGDAPDAPPLFAMSFVEGESIEPDLDDVAALPPPAEIAARAASAARQLGALHRLRPADIGLGDEPEIAVADEIARWDKAFSTVAPELRHGHEACSAALHATCPEPAPSSIVHGDFRLGNTLCRDGEVVAIIDWEIWALGDPRLDLAWFLLTADPALHPSLVRDAPGMPAPAELVAHYVDAGGPDPGSTRWFTALTLYKLAATTALLVKNSIKRGVAGPQVERATDGIPIMIERASALLA